MDHDQDFMISSIISLLSRLSPLRSIFFEKMSFQRRAFYLHIHPHLTMLKNNVILSIENKERAPEFRRKLRILMQKHEYCVDESYKKQDENIDCDLSFWRAQDGGHLAGELASLFQNVNDAKGLREEGHQKHHDECRLCHVAFDVCDGLIYGPEKMRAIYENLLARKDREAPLDEERAFDSMDELFLQVFEQVVAFQGSLRIHVDLIEEEGTGALKKRVNKRHQFTTPDATQDQALARAIHRILLKHRYHVATRQDLLIINRWLSNKDGTNRFIEKIFKYYFDEVTDDLAVRTVYYSNLKNKPFDEVVMWNEVGLVYGESALGKLAENARRLNKPFYVSLFGLMREYNVIVNMI
jgi:hypothetical protein